MTSLTKNLRFFSVAPVLAGLLAASGVSAAALPTFNSYLNDQEFLTGRNITNNQASFTDPVQANGGEDVEVAVYYHNTGVDTVAHNTTLKVTIPTAEDLRHVLTGSITADGMTAVTGTVVNGVEVGQPNLTINSDVKTTVAFVPGSVRWYPERMDQSGQGANLPSNQNGDTIVSSGLNIGDIAYCWEHSGYVHFKVHLTGQTVTPPSIKVTKEVRKAGSTDAFVDSTTANPGSQLEYRVTVRNVDGALSAKNVKLVDILPAGLHYVGPTVLRLSDGTTSTLPDGIAANDGIVVVPELKANDSLQVSFLVSSDKDINDNVCLTNTVTASSPNAKDSVQDTAKACFLKVSTATPTPVVTATPTPAPATPVPATPAPTAKPVTLPVTGPGDASLMLTAGISGLGALGATARRISLKRNLKKSLRNLDII